MGLAGLLELAGYGRSSGESCACRDRGDDGSRAPGSPGEGGAQHGGGWSGECRKMARKGRRFPSRDLQLPMGGLSMGGAGDEEDSNPQNAIVPLSR